MTVVVRSNDTLTNKSEISILWKGRVKLGTGGEDDDQLTAERIVQIFQSDLVSRCVGVTVPASPLSDPAWLDPVEPTE